MTDDPFAVGFTGSRKTPTDWQQKRMLELFQFLVSQGAESFHHGDCIGSDAVAHELAVRAGFDHVVIHPPILTRNQAYCGGDKSPLPPRGISFREPHPYLVRNRNIIRDTHILVATPKGEEILRSGTWSTIRYAKECDRHIYIIHPFRIDTVNEPFDWEPASRFVSPWEK